MAASISSCLLDSIPNTCAPNKCHNSLTWLIESTVHFSCGVSITFRFKKSSAYEAENLLCSEPAIGWPGTNRLLNESFCSITTFTIGLFTLATSVTMQFSPITRAISGMSSTVVNEGSAIIKMSELGANSFREPVLSITLSANA